MASTLFVLCPNKLNQASADNDYDDNYRAVWEAQTFIQGPGWGGSKSWYQEHTRRSLKPYLHKFSQIYMFYFSCCKIYKIISRTDHKEQSWFICQLYMDIFW